MVWALAVTETVSYGVLYYSFAAFLLPMQHSLGWSQTALTGAFSVSVLVTGVAAVPAGAWLDRHGARALMTAGSVLAAGCVLSWAAASTVPVLYVAFAGIGLAGAAVLYEPAFATVNAWFDARRRDALLTVTMAAGLASTIFLPAAVVLISHLGWRHALIVLAVVQAATAVPHVLLLRRRPADYGWARDGVRTPADQSPGAARPADPAPRGPVAAAQVAHALARPAVVLLTASAVVGSAAIAAVAVHLLAYLRLDGYSAAVAAALTGALGAVQVGGRVVLTAAARRVPTAAAAAVLLAAQAVGVAALLLISGPAGVGIFVLLFGLGYGVLNIARPDLLARYAVRRLFARLSGIQALLVIAGEAAGPAGAAVLRAVTGSYTPVFVTIAAASVCSAVLLVAAERACCPGTMPWWPRLYRPRLTGQQCQEH
jgi:MFS family permease